MPVERNNFDKYTDTDAADRACLEAIGIAAEQAMRSNYAPSGIGVITGNLKRSQGHVVSGDHVDIGASADYAREVHNGTSNKRGRPWIKNGIQANRDAILEHGKQAWEAVMRG